MKDSEQTVRQHLEEILKSNLFVRSERMARFLRVAVERTLAGKADDLKEYVIGVEVFDRRPDYDPRVDPIVRVEARRLRAKLHAYYQAEKPGGAVRIELPAGSYVPRFTTCAAATEPAAAETGPVTIAVLPLLDLSANHEHEYLSDGLTEELIHALTKLPGMQVVAWDSAARLRGRQQDLDAIRSQLRVSVALTGSVRVAGRRLRVRVQLIDTASGVYLWSETLDREMEDVFAIQEEIARAIMRTLRLQLGTASEAGSEARFRASFASYDWYLKGRHLWHQRGRQGLLGSVECFEKAIAADANAALGYTGLADAYSLLVDYGLLAPAEGIPRARTAVQRAISLDPELAEAYVSLAFIRSLYDHQWDEAEGLYHHGIALNPGYATAHHWLGLDFYALQGRFAEATTEMELATTLDPLSSIVKEGRSYLLLLMGRAEEAVAGYRKLLEVDPGFYKGYTSMGRALAQLGRYGEAAAMLEQGRSLAGDIPTILGALGQVKALAGDHEGARALLSQLLATSETTFVPSTSVALVYVGLGDKESALEWLERGLARNEAGLSALKVHPAYDSLRGEVRFGRLLTELRLG